MFSYPSHVRPSTQAADCTVDVSDLIHNLLYDISIPRIRQLFILLLCLEWYWELNSEPMLGRHPSPELHSQTLVLSF